MSQSKATIIGGQGFIGSHLCSKLIDLEWDCRIPDKQAPLNQHKNMGHIFYCAGLTADYIDRPYDTVEAHVTLLNRILNNCRFQSLTYLSSTRLYDNFTGDIGTEKASLSLNPGNARHIYDISKALGESLCLALGKGQARVARLSCVYNDHTDKDGFLPSLLHQIITQHPSDIEVHSSPYAIRDYVHLQDVLDALIFIATKGNSLIYNVASGENVSNKSLFETLSEISNCNIQPLLHNHPRPPCSISISKMQKEFNWQPVSVLKKITTILQENI